MDEPSDSAASAGDLFGDGTIRLIIRTDDVGFCHAANMAFARIAQEGCVTAASVIVNTPWLDEAVEVLRAHPEISVGVHTCLNSEWTPYRWGPVLPADRVSSLVDEWGHFFGSSAELMARNPDPDEVEREMRAQVELALRKGLRISYIDHHMLTVVRSREMRERFARVARDLSLGVSGWFGERPGPAMYSEPPEHKAQALIEGLEAIAEPGVYLVIAHPGLNVPEMAVLRDRNPMGLPDMAIHRQAETDALCDPRLRSLLRERGMELLGYDSLRERFLDRVRSPCD
jgi:predicted glycoside hydrolase/deacetylase ChbG (UPF0249 family)